MAAFGAGPDVAARASELIGPYRAGVPGSSTCARGAVVLPARAAPVEAAPDTGPGPAGGGGGGGGSGGAGRGSRAVLAPVGVMTLLLLATMTADAAGASVDRAASFTSGRVIIAPMAADSGRGVWLTRSPGRPPPGRPAAVDRGLGGRGDRCRHRRGPWHLRAGFPRDETLEGRRPSNRHRRTSRQAPGPPSPASPAANPLQC